MHIAANIDDCAIIIEDFLEKDYFNRIKSAIVNNETFPFYFKPAVASESDKKTLAEYIQAADETGFVKKVKVGANSYYAQSDIIPTYEVVKSKDMKPVEEGGKFEFSAEDVGVIFIEEDTREVYTFDSAGNKRPIINM